MQINNQRRARPLVQALRRRRSLRAGLSQLLYIAAGIGLGLLVPTLEAGARIPSVEVAALLAGVTAGLLALTGIVFALLFLVVQFAATAQSPRLHRPNRRWQFRVARSKSAGLAPSGFCATSTCRS